MYAPLDKYRDCVVYFTNGKKYVLSEAPKWVLKDLFKRKHKCIIEVKTKEEGEDK